MTSNEDLILKLVELYGEEHEEGIRNEIAHWDAQEKLKKERGCDYPPPNYEDQVYLRIASIKPYEHGIWKRCPICDSFLEGEGYSQFASAKCPKGHYIYQGQGSYASKSTVIIDGKKETYRHDDICCTVDLLQQIKFYDRIRELRGMKKVPVREVFLG